MYPVSSFGIQILLYLCNRFIFNIVIIIIIELLQFILNKLMKIKK